MNVHTPITDLTATNMTSKGQVLIPKAIRDRVGLIPGGAVQVGLNDRGEAVVLPFAPGRGETPQLREARVLDAIDAVAGRYSFGASTDDYMAMIRGPYSDQP